MELLPPEARNWQAEVGEGRVHSDAGRWAGATLGAWHAATSLATLPERFGDLESFEQQRLRPFYETVIERRPELAEAIAPLLAELRADRRCLVHGDYAPKNMLVGPAGNWILDFEVAHYGNPVFDLGFFLSFVVLSAIRWKPLEQELRKLADGFRAGYAETAGAGFAGDETSVTAHTAALDPRPHRRQVAGPVPRSARPAIARGRSGYRMLREPERGLWQWAA